MSTENPAGPADHAQRESAPSAEQALLTPASERATELEPVLNAATDDASTAAGKHAVRPKKPVEPLPARHSFWSRIDRPFAFGFLTTLGALAAILLGLALSNLSTVLIYIALALFVALGLDPAVRFFERRGLTRALAVVIVMSALLIVLGLVLWLIIPTVVDQVASFVTSVPDMVAAFMMSDLFAVLQDRFGDNIESLVEDGQAFITNPNNIAAIGGGALQVGASIANGISGFIIVLVLTLYFVATLPTIKRAMLRLAPARDRQNADIIATQITDSVGGYVMGMVTLAFFNATLVFVLFAILRLPFPALLAVVAFLITLIPLVGSLLFWVIGSVVALFNSPVAAIIFALIYLVYMQLESYILTPRVMNKAIAIPGSLVVIGALVGGTLLGLLGALVAVPVTASILIIIKQVWIPKQDARI